MKRLFFILNWLSALFFLVLLVLSLWSGYGIPSLILAVLVLFVFPPARRAIGRFVPGRVPAWIRGSGTLLLFFLYLFLLFRNLGNPGSIYKNEDIRAGLMRIYDEKMTQWPVPYHAMDLDTRYGHVHVIASGPENAPVIVLCHASAVASWSWFKNIGALSANHRVYAIDTIGDAGKSELTDAGIFPQTGQALAAFYSAIMDSLGIDKACLIGASQGGFIATNLALHAPGRVQKLVLCGPMGYTGTNWTVLKIIGTAIFPVRPLQEDCFEWAFGDDADIRREMRSWFFLILEGVFSKQARPMPFTQEQFRRIRIPVLLLLGTRDGLVGDPGKTEQVVRAIPDVHVEILETGHLIGMEKPDRFNTLILDFLQKDKQE
ncbi:alpha/beta fold hydrolase [bacterium]|nr:alpha/beta fold hydrolase [bacterium]